MFQMFNKTLLIYDYARVKDAIELLKKELELWQQGDKHDETENIMKKYLQGISNFFGVNSVCVIFVFLCHL